MCFIRMCVVCTSLASLKEKSKIRFLADAHSKKRSKIMPFMWKRNLWQLGFIQHLFNGNCLLLWVAPPYLFTLFETPAHIRYKKNFLFFLKCFQDIFINRSSTCLFYVNLLFGENSSCISTVFPLRLHSKQTTTKLF